MPRRFDEAEGGTAVPLQVVPKTAIPFTPRPLVWRDPATIDRRPWLYGFELLRGHLSMVVSPGAGGKTTFKLARALAMVTGRDFLGHRVWNGPHRCWLVNLEDPMDEIERTLHALCIKWGITAADIGDRLFLDAIDSLDPRLFKLGVIDPVTGCASINAPMRAGLVAAMLELGVDYLDVDPLVSSHGLEENDNGQMDLVAKEWVQIAQETNAAVCLAHHVRKPNGGDASAFDARGAVAFINAARSVLVMNKMSAEQAEKLQVPECERKSYVSVIDDKNNRRPPVHAAEWYVFEGVDLGNADIGSPGPADNVASLKRWNPPDAFGGVTKAELFAIQNAVAKADADVAAGRVRKNGQATRYVGHLVAPILGLNMDNPLDRSRIGTMVREWLSNGFLRSEPGKTAKGDPTDFIVVGNPVERD